MILDVTYSKYIMIRIQKDRNIITSISIFTVKDSSDQQRLIDMLREATKQIMIKHHGFISANIHKSLDGTKVINYVQWENKEAIEKMFNDPSAIIHMNDVDSIAKVDRSLYEVVFVEETE
jgi:heme-degrading monooxygenase HmoA